MKMKNANQAGVFYPKAKDELISLFEGFEHPDDVAYNSRIIIVPHAAILYSGNTAFKAYRYLDKSVKNVFIIAPDHYEKIYGCCVSDYDIFETPLGNLIQNLDLSKEFAKFCDCQINNYAFEKEHSVEVQLPFIKYLLPNAKIIPILYGCENFKNLSESIKKFYVNKENAFVISSDLSHFYPEKEAVRIDTYTANMIERNDVTDFEMEQACGAVGICGALNFAKTKKYNFIRIGLTNSSEITQNSSRVVGYGSWFLFEGQKNEFIKDFYSKLIIKIAKESILTGLQLGCTHLEYPCVFEETGACFVTLKINGELRGCMGSIMPYRSLIKDLYSNAHAAAFSDSRFALLTTDEFKHLQVSVSLLSQPERIDFSSEADLLCKITPHKDGLIIRDGLYEAVFLPSVWDMLPEKLDFLKALKKKAGMNENYSSETMEAFIFQTINISE